jgi:queuine tRNA-ribosyltransferase
MDSEPSPSHEMTFSILGSAAPVLAPRVGTLALAGRQAIATPNLVPLSSRGAVPHISHDMVRKETSINSLYIGLEDCMCNLISFHLLWLLGCTVL